MSSVHMLVYSITAWRIQAKCYTNIATQLRKGIRKRKIMMENNLKIMKTQSHKHTACQTLSISRHIINHVLVHWDTVGSRACVRNTRNCTQQDLELFSTNTWHYLSFYLYRFTFLQTPQGNILPDGKTLFNWQAAAYKEQRKTQL